MSSRHEPNLGDVPFDDFFNVDEKQFAGSQFVMEMFRTFQDAYRKAKNEYGLTQQAIADRLSLNHRSIVNRWLKGQENISGRTMGELAWALNCRARLVLEPLNTNALHKAVEWAPEARVVAAPENDAWKRHAQIQEKSNAILENV